MARAARRGLSSRPVVALKTLNALQHSRKKVTREFRENPYIGGMPSSVPSASTSAKKAAPAEATSADVRNVVEAAGESLGKLFAAPRSAPVLVPVRTLGPAHRERIAQHLLALDSRDRYLRFGYPASDEQIQRYVAGINFDKDEVFGIYNRRLTLIAVAHLAFTVSRDLSAGAEFGVSVLPHTRGRGFGARLYERAARHARNEGVECIYIHALSENRAMLKIARNAGATVERNGSEAEAHLRLPPATLDSRVTEMMEEHLAFTDYRIKAQAQQIRRFFSGFQSA